MSDPTLDKWWNPRRPAGFRLSLRDAIVIAACAPVTWLLWQWLGQLALLCPVVLGHFFLFCNVFRPGNRSELVWAGVFMVNVCAWTWLGFNWWYVLLSQTPVTLAVITFAFRRTDYHGIGWRAFHRWRLKRNEGRPMKPRKTRQHVEVSAVPKPSPALQAFLAAFFSELLVRDGPDFECLHRLQGDDHNRAEEMLIREVEAEPFHWHIYALGELRSQASIPLLRELLQHRSALDRIYAAHALHRITGFPQAAEVVAQVLRRSSRAHSRDRQDAAMLLRDIPGQVSEKALHGTLYDPDRDVAYQTLESLCHLMGIASPTGSVVRLPDGKARPKMPADSLHEIEDAWVRRWTGEASTQRTNKENL